MNYEKIHSKSLRIFLCIFLFVFILSFLPTASAQTLSISPSSQSASLWSDNYVTVDVQITGVTDLAGFQLDLLYDGSILYVQSDQSITEGTFLSNSGADSTDWTRPKVNTSGLIDDAACVRLKEQGVPYAGVNGNGILADVQLEIFKGGATPGRSYLNLTGIKLSDSNTTPITFSTLSAYVDTFECLGSESRPCTACSENGTRVCSGNVWGLCNATCPPDICDGLDNDQDGYIDNIPGVNQDYTLTRQCSDNYLGACAVGNETCTEASGWAGCPVPEPELCNDKDEDCDGDNTECTGDVTGDGCIDLFDIVAVSSKFGLTSADPGWDDSLDLVDNDEIDIFDLVTVARDFGNGPNCPP